MSHPEIEMDPDEQKNLRYRLFARAIRINGLPQIKDLKPYLQVRLEKTFQEKIEPHVTPDGEIRSFKSRVPL